MVAVMAGCFLTGCKSISKAQFPKAEMTAYIKESLPNERDVSFSFADVSNLEFWFQSGAGAWRTVLTVHADGTFKGEYSDSDMNVTYLCNFMGKFTEPIKVDEYTYSVKMKYLKLEQEPNTQEIKDGVTYIYSEPYGLDDVDELLFYLPGKPLDNLSEDYLMWMCLSRYSNNNKLPFYGLYNVNGKQGCTSHEKTTIDNRLVYLEQEDTVLRKKLETQSSLCQAEMNGIVEERYRLWNAELNLIWSQLKEKLDVTNMESLTKEELEWIANKEAEMQKSGLEVEGCSLYPICYYGKGQELTRSRVYELAEYLR